METRPNETELKRGWAKAKYETRMVLASRDSSHIIGPLLATREMQIPVSGRVECTGYHKGTTSVLAIAAKDSMTEYWKRQATEPNPNWPEAKRKTEKQIGIVVGRKAKPELLNIREVDRSKPWYIRSIGGLEFAPPELRYYRGGEIVSYKDESRHPASRKGRRAEENARAVLLKVCPGTSNGITEFSEHEAD